LSATRLEVERLLREAREREVSRLRRAGRRALCWGYARRSELQTPVGNIGPIRIPRMRVDGEEVRLIPRQVRRIRSLEDLTGEATIAGISQRRMGTWLRRATDQSMSAATVGRITLELGREVLEQRARPLGVDEYAALAVDGVYGKYRGRGDAVLAIAMGVRWDGTFDAVDWETGQTESASVYEHLLGRIESRGARNVWAVVGDGAGGVPSAQEMVYPQAQYQLCLWHLSRVLLTSVPKCHRRAFSRDFWEVYNGLDPEEVQERTRAFRKRWRRRAPGAITTFDRNYEHTLWYLMFSPEWRHRVRTVNLAEGFFRNFRRFFNRFPGFNDEEHLSRVIGLYLLGSRPERWGRRQLALAG